MTQANEYQPDPPPAAETSTTPAENITLQQLQDELARLREQQLRDLAEADNQRKRLLREREDMAKYAVSNFARELLAVADNLARAIAAVPAEGREQLALKNLLAGVEATERQLQSAFTKAGIARIEAVGQPFDPNFHRVMTEQDDAQQAPGTVLQVLQAGYTIHGRLLREAMVVVARGGTAAPPHLDQTA